MVHDLGIDGFTIAMFLDCVLHTVDMGVASRYIGTCFIHGLRSNTFQLTNSTMAARLEQCMIHLRRGLTAYYKTCDKRLGVTKCSRIQQLTLKKLGKLDKPCLKAKGMQTRNAIGYAVQFMEVASTSAAATVTQTLIASQLFQAGRHLLRWFELCEQEKRSFALTDQLALHDACINHLALYEAAGGHMVHKHHAFVHLTDAVCDFGNPLYFSTHFDESENGTCGKICEAVHPTTFAMSVFERLELSDRK